MIEQNNHTHREIELINALRRLGGSARSVDLARMLSVSEETVRRTIKALAKTGTVARVRGGAYLVGTQNDPGFFQRISEETSEKHSIATCISGMITDGMTVFLDACTICELAAHELRERVDLTVVTNSISVAQTLLSYGDKTVFLLGGEIQRHMRGTSGAASEAQARRFSYDIAVLGADGFSGRQGFLYQNGAEAQLASTVAQSAERVCLAMVHNNLNKSAPHCGVDLQQADVLVTDRQPEKDYAVALEIEATKVFVADRNEQNDRDE